MASAANVKYALILKVFADLLKGFCFKKGWLPLLDIIEQVVKFSSYEVYYWQVCVYVCGCLCGFVCLCVCMCMCFHHPGYMSQRVSYYERKLQTHTYPSTFMSYIIDGMAQQHCLLPHLGFDCPFRLTIIFLKNYFSVFNTFRQRPYIYWVVAPTPSRNPCAWSTLQCLQVCKSSISYNICSTNQVNTEHSEIFELAQPTLPSLVCFWTLKNAS